MIEGFRIEVTADELARHLDERIRHHHDRAADFERRAKELEVIGHSGLDDDDEGLVGCWGLNDQLERKTARHRDRETVLVYLRNHLVAGEVYRLSEGDLRSLELFPVELRAL